MSDIVVPGEEFGEERSSAPIAAIVVPESGAAVPRRPAPGLWGAIGWTLLLLFVLNGLSIALVIALSVVQVDLEEAMFVLLPASSLATTCFAILVTSLIFEGHVGRVLGWRWPSPWQVAASVLLVAPLGAIVQEISAWASEVLPSFNSEFYESFAKGSWVLVLISGCLLPGIGEEIFFRGFLGRGLVARWGLWWGTIWTSLLFAAIHLDPTQMTGVFFIGVALQLVFLASKSLLIPMLVHALNNALSFGVVKAGVFSEVDYLPREIVGCALVALVPLAVVLWQSRSRWVLPDGTPWSPGYLTAESPRPELAARVENGRPTWIWLGVLLVSQAIFWTVAVRAA
jgi:membrane protease YdiL (CAAX protease family)